mmetsp:Transcript_29497/g.90424  ORF Transcript_29497/g.90424 Transcript_29497/m.90424 type:complete len:443 (+) Transcript_29497:3276-4604(+)
MAPAPSAPTATPRPQAAERASAGELALAISSSEAMSCAVGSASAAMVPIAMASRKCAPAASEAAAADSSESPLKKALDRSRRARTDDLSTEPASFEMELSVPVAIRSSVAASPSGVSSTLMSFWKAWVPLPAATAALTTSAHALTACMRSTLVSGVRARITRLAAGEAPRSSSRSDWVAAASSPPLAEVERATRRSFSKSSADTFQLAPLLAMTARALETLSSSTMAALAAASFSAYSREMISRSAIEARTAASSSSVSGGGSGISTSWNSRIFFSSWFVAVSMTSSTSPFLAALSISLEVESERDIAFSFFFGAAPPVAAASAAAAAAAFFFLVVASSSTMAFTPEAAASLAARLAAAASFSSRKRSRSARSACNFSRMTIASACTAASAWRDLIPAAPPPPLPSCCALSAFLARAIADFCALPPPIAIEERERERERASE